MSATEALSADAKFAELQEQIGKTFYSEDHQPTLEDAAFLLGGAVMLATTFLAERNRLRDTVNGAVVAIESILAEEYVYEIGIPTNVILRRVSRALQAQLDGPVRDEVMAEADQLRAERDRLVTLIENAKASNDPYFQVNVQLRKDAEAERDRLQAELAETRTKAWEGLKFRAELAGRASRLEEERDRLQPIVDALRGYLQANELFNDDDDDEPGLTERYDAMVNNWTHLRLLLDELDRSPDVEADLDFPIADFLDDALDELDGDPAGEDQ